MNSFDSAPFKKFDLHIHTPNSLCYSDVAVTPEQIVKAAITAGLDAIGITDHNTARGIDEIRKVSDKTKLAIFPGIELTTKSGHFLAIFEIDTPVIKLEKLLDTIGIKPEFRGDGAVQILCETEDVFKAIVSEGGLVIAAHIERWPSGFLETKESRSSKMELHANPLLSALEITVAENKEQWNKGLTRGYPKKYACIQGSDAHAPGEVGRRPFLVRTEQIGLSVLKSAFANWDNVIVFPDQGPSASNR